MTGGMIEAFELNDFDDFEKQNFWNILHNAYQKKSIIFCYDGSLKDASSKNDRSERFLLFILKKNKL
jgi:hypothetical protein